MIAASSIPLLCLITIYIDNDWPDDQENAILTLLHRTLQGYAGLPPTCLKDFIRGLDSLAFATLDLPSYLHDLVPVD